MSKTILVTGGAGYIGSHTCVELIRNGFDVIILDNLYNSSEVAIDRIEEITGGFVTFIRGDVRNLRTVATLFYEHSVDAVIHLAGLKAPAESVEKPLSYYDVNVGGTINLLGCMEDANVNHLVFSSSANVYANDGTQEYFNESSPLGPNNPYGQTKLTCENILNGTANANNQAKFGILRYFNPVGAHPSGLIGEDPMDIPNNLAPRITGVLVGKYPKLYIYGNDYNTQDGTGIRDYIHVVDLARAHVATLSYLFFQEIGVSQTLNIGTGNGTSVLELINGFEEVSNANVAVEFADRRIGDVPTCIADPTKANHILGWTAEYDIMDMCKDALHWQVNNPNGYRD